MELGFHADAYKVDACPYLELTRRGGYEKEECPFARDEEWFRERFEVRKVKGNMVFVRMDGARLHLCLDMCCFWHSQMDRRFIGDAPMPMPMSKEHEQKQQAQAQAQAQSAPRSEQRQSVSPPRQQLQQQQPRDDVIPPHQYDQHQQVW